MRELASGGQEPRKILHVAKLQLYDKPFGLNSFSLISAAENQVVSKKVTISKGILE